VKLEQRPGNDGLRLRNKALEIVVGVHPASTECVVRPSAKNSVAVIAREGCSGAIWASSSASHRRTDGEAA
jgi:hypothetical protein